MRALVATWLVLVGCASSPSKVCPADEPATSKNPTIPANAALIFVVDLLKVS